MLPFLFIHSNLFIYFKRFSLFLVKKQTLNLYNFETELLKNYKHYLQKLEKMARVLYNKSFSPNVDEKKIQLAILAVNCMCDLLVTHAYFNFTTNLIRFLIPLMDCKLPIIRQAVFESFTQVFKDDKRGDLSLIVNNNCFYLVSFIFFIFNY